MKKEKVNRYTLALREDIDSKAEDIMAWEGIQKSEVFRRALLYYHFFVQSVVENDQTIYLVNKQTDERQRLILPAELMEPHHRKQRASKSIDKPADKQADLVPDKVASSALQQSE